MRPEMSESRIRASAIKWRDNDSAIRALTLVPQTPATASASSARSSGGRSARRQTLNRLPGYCGNELEVLVEVQNREVGLLGASCDQQVGDRRRSVLAALGQRQLDFDRSVLDSRREVLDRRAGERRAFHPGSQVLGGAGREADFEASDPWRSSPTRGRSCWPTRWRHGCARGGRGRTCRSARWSRPGAAHDVGVFKVGEGLGKPPQIVDVDVTGLPAAAIRPCSPVTSPRSGNPRSLVAVTGLGWGRMLRLVDPDGCLVTVDGRSSPP